MKYRHMKLKKQFPKGTDFLLRHKSSNKPTTTQDISLQFTKLLRELKIVGSSVYSIRYSVTTELAKLANGIARQLTSNSSQDNERKMICYPISPYLTSGPPIICIPTRGELEIMRKLPRELKVRTSGKMLMVGWSARNDNDEIRTLRCQSLISLIQRIIDKEMLSAY
ncbi:MAG: hypothetical protein EZS28_032860 [Streblomastix strix]|uniref:Uncharacterized protein n=1 Tax=Streblomastix strix TaxID=222440 RepID=A0A5J4UN70_9EUKA|nr:MAG: hypothetical protein EZS28_032860 [Streblomastix strix]